MQFYYSHSYKLAYNTLPKLLKNVSLVFIFSRRLSTKTYPDYLVTMRLAFLTVHDSFGSEKFVPEKIRVRKKSTNTTIMDTITTVRVVESPTPAVPPRV